MELMNTALERFSGQGWNTAVYTRPFGRQLVCEVTDTEYAQDAKIPYHVQNAGHETAILLSGRAQVTLYGRCCTLLPGDLVQIEPYMPHGFHFLEEGSVLRTIYHGVDAARLLHQRQRILSQCGDDAKSAVLELLAREGIRLLPEPAAEPAEKLPEISPKGSGQEVFPRSGVVCSLRAGRWQLDGQAEVWELALEAGKTLASPALPQQPSLLMVSDGAVRVTANGRTFTAQAGSLLWSAPCEAFSLTAEDGGAALLDLHCSALLLRYLEELELAESTSAAADLAALTAVCQNPVQGLA